MILQGWRARIGFIYPSSGRRDHEFLKLLPQGVSGHFTRVAFGGRGDLQTIWQHGEAYHFLGLHV